MTQPMLFDLPAPAVPEQNCVTCSASGAGPMFIEPVSRECGTCNGATVGQLLTAYRTGSLPQLKAAAARHGLNPDRVRLPRR